MNRVLILGGGFGGVAAAHRLKQLLPPEDEVLLVDRREAFMMGFRKTWELVGFAPASEGQRPLENLGRIGARVIRDTVTAIHPAERRVELGSGSLEADALLVALGAELAPELVPGLQQYGHNVYDPEENPRAARALGALSGGNLLVGIFGVPYKCPPAPYELALLAKESLAKRGAKVNVVVFTPQPSSLPVLGQTGCDVLESRLADAGIAFLPNYKATAVEAGEVVFANARWSFDLLLGVPPHRPPAAVRESGLTGESGWVPVEARSMQTRFPGVYAVGDVVQIQMADGKPLPKAGVFAESMGNTAAEHIAAQLAGGESGARFIGEGHCYLEVGGGQAMMVKGRFLAEPAPQVVLTEASPQNLAEKVEFETRHLREWFA
jgi:sulfide:quinone oxidoreductase